MKFYSRIILLMLPLLVAGPGCRVQQIPLLMRTHVTQELMPAIDTSPIVEMAVGQGSNCANKVAIIDVDGLLVNANRPGMMSYGTNPVADFRAKLDYARRHVDLRAIVVRINSPGGGVTASDMMWQDLQRFKQETGRPIVVSLMDVGAGGAYYLATAGDLIIAHPTSITGGFGVIFNAYNMEDFLAEINIVGVTVKSGTQTDLGNPLRQMSAESRAILQQITDEFQQRFQQRIVAGRGMKLNGDEQFLDGRILTANQAQQVGLIDSIGYLDDAVKAAAELAGCGDSRPILLHRCRDKAETPYAITPADPIERRLIPVDIPGLNRAELPSFLYLWQPNPSLH